MKVQYLVPKNKCNLIYLIINFRMHFSKLFQHTVVLFSRIAGIL